MKNYKNKPKYTQEEFDSFSIEKQLSVLEADQDNEVKKGLADYTDEEFDDLSFDEQVEVLTDYFPGDNINNEHSNISRLAHEIRPVWNSSSDPYRIDENINFTNFTLEVEYSSDDIIWSRNYILGCIYIRLLIISGSEVISISPSFAFVEQDSSENQENLEYPSWNAEPICDENGNDIGLVDIHFL